MKNALMNCPLCDSDNVYIYILDARRNYFSCHDCKQGEKFKKLKEVTR